MAAVLLEPQRQYLLPAAILEADRRILVEIIDGFIAYVFDGSIQFPGDEISLACVTVFHYSTFHENLSQFKWLRDDTKKPSSFSDTSSAAAPCDPAGNGPECHHPGHSPP